MSNVFAKIDKLFLILIYRRHFLCPPFHISFFVPLTLPAEEPDIVPRRGFIRSPAPPESLFYKRISPRRILPINSTTRHSGSYFFGFASAFSDRTVQPSLDHRHTESCLRYTLFPAQARKAQPSPAPEFLFSAHLSARARPPCAHSDRQPRVNIRTGSRRLISRKAFCRRIGRRF